MVVETVVKNGKIVSPGGIISGGIAIQDGKILAVCKDSELPEAKNTIDAGSNYILPGIVGVHVHGGFLSLRRERSCWLASIDNAKG